MAKSVKYNDKPRFNLINEYENTAKKAYQKTVITTVKQVGIKMLEMTSKAT